MVGNVNSPEKPAIMINPVFKVKCKIYHYEQKEPVKKRIFNFQKLVLVAPREYTYIKQPAKECIKTGIQYGKVNVLNCISEGIVFLMFKVT